MCETANIVVMEIIENEVSILASYLNSKLYG